MKALAYGFTTICLLSAVLVGCGGGGGGGNNNEESNPAPSPNQPPVISNLTASPNPVSKGQTMTVSATASDPEGDTLNYQWTVPAGYTIQSGQGSPQIVVLATQLLAKGNVQVTVSDGSLTATSSVAVSTNDGAWGTAGSIENDNGQNYSPQIAIAANGDAIAVWTQYDGTRNSVWANRYVASTGWETAGSIETDANSNWELQVATDANGNAIAVWTQQQCGNDGPCRYTIWADRYDVAGGSWGTAVQINSGDGSSYYNNSPQVAMDASGNAIVVWTQYDDGNANLWTNRYVAGVGWEGAKAQTHAGYNYNSQIAMDAKGDAIIVWMQYGINILAKRYVAGGDWEKTVLIESVSGYSYSNLQIAMNAGGDAIVVWGQCTDTQCNQGNIWASRYVADKDWETAMQVETANLPLQCYPDQQVAMDASGNAIVVWTQYTYTTDNGCNQPSIQANRYTAGTGWGTAAPIETDDKDNWGPRIAMDPSGNAIAVWTQCGGEAPCNILANRYVAGTGWGTAAPIDTNDQDNYYPQIAMAAGGDAVAVWTQYDGTLDNIWANAFK
ncbi:MAG: hypothetical protein U1F76_10925 [Candidatus Competibacteraceae bacterium]